MKRATRSISVLLVLGALLVAGPLARAADPPSENPSSAWIWPLPPDQPRVRHLLSFITPQDMGAKKGFFARLWEFIAGEDTAQGIRSPHGVVSDGEGKVYVADWGSASIHLFHFAKKKYDAFNKTKIGPLASPIGLALDSDGLLYVSDSAKRRVFVFNGTKNRRVIGDDSLVRPTGVAINQKERLLYVVDTGGHRVDAFSLEGKPLFSFGARGGGPGEFNYPTHIAVDQGGDVYVVDSLNFRIQIFAQNGAYLSQFGGNSTSIHDFVKPKGIAVDREGNIWVSDSLRNSIQVFDRKGRLLLIFGSLGDGAGQFQVPAGIAADSRDQLFIADSYNYRVQVFQYLKVNSSN